MIQVGGHGATQLDFEIPKKYGLHQTIADTSGVGAVFRALRTIPVMLGIAGDMAELCPQAWMLNYTNPMAMNCWAWYAGSPHQHIVGLCHSIQNTSRQVAEYVGVPPRGDHLPRRRREPHELGAARRARRQEPLPGARRGDRGRPRRARPPRPRAGLPALRLLSHREQRALCRVRAVVHARRRRDRAPADPRRRVRAAQRGEPRAVRRREAQAGCRRALRDRTQPGVRGADRALDGHRRAAHRLRQRAQHRPHHQPAGERLRRGARAWSTGPGCSPRTSATCRCSARRSTAPS